MQIITQPPTLPNDLPRIRWNITQYENLFAMGLLKDEGYELIEGDIVPKMPIKYTHPQIITLLITLFVRFFDAHRLFSAFSLHIDEENLPEPDFAILRNSRATPTERGYITTDQILMIAEVADATLTSDLTRKALLYAKANIEEYWVVDINGERVLVHTMPTNSGYGRLIEFDRTDTITLTGIPDVSIKVIDLFS